MAQWIQQWIDGVSRQILEQEFYSWLQGLDNAERKLPSSSVPIDNPQLDLLKELWPSNVELRRVLERVLNRFRDCPDHGPGFKDHRRYNLRDRCRQYVGGLAQVSCRYSQDCAPNFSLNIEIANIHGQIERSS